jgi:hypothetical protein
VAPPAVKWPAGATAARVELPRTTERAERSHGLIGGDPVAVAANDDLVNRLQCICGKIHSDPGSPGVKGIQINSVRPENGLLINLDRYSSVTSTRTIAMPGGQTRQNHY